MNNVTDILGRCIICFTSDPSKANTIISILQSQYSKVNQQLDQVNNKLDRLLSAPERKFQLHLREANLYHKFKKKQESADELKAANDAAKDAFNTADNIEGWVKATDFRMTCAFMKLSFDISPRKDTELQILGETLKLHLDDLREKIEDRKIRDQEEANSASFGSGKAKKKEAEENREQYDLAEGKLLKTVYLDKKDRKDKVDTKDKKDKSITITPTVSLVWSINDDKHEAILPNLMLELEPFPITISKSKLEGFRRGGMKVDLNRTLSLNPGVLKEPKKGPSSHFPSLAHQPISEPGSSLETERTPKASKHDKRPRCSICSRKIKDQELKALDVSFHPTCFNCSQCGDNLSGDDIRFMADDAKEIFCLDCYNK
ncbi:hypothetical protein TCAL_14880 [Tigriopus californicus]|uniref:LIM zinc-binding domain-containing protein n=1 Tax=Tigriopus californicus TaxID=6832 RepID=A0A553P1U9_TIGCA|nr:hypothetical protein TCAL_14880 [Tigriopus californicus]